MSNSELRAMFAPVWGEVSHVWTRDIFRDVVARHDNELHRPADYINHSLYLEAKTFLHGLFVVEDKLSMAHALESRVPFMDNDLVDFAMRCPVGMKLGSVDDAVRINENDSADKRSARVLRTRHGKQLLRDVMARYIPSEIAGAQKQGFSSPDASWFRGDSIDFVQRRLFSDSARLYQFVDRDAVTQMVSSHLRGEENRRLLIWSLLNVDQFLCENIS